MAFSFMHKEKGSHPNDNKHYTNSKTIVDATVPKLLVFPLSMHICAPVELIVEVGERVKAGHILVKEGGFVSALVYSSVFGEVVAIEERPSAGGGSVNSIIIKNDYEYVEADPIVEPGHS